VRQTPQTSPPRPADTGAAFSEAEIDRGSPVPFYFQLARTLRDEIVSGRWQTQERLPSEAELCNSFELSRATVRQALALLESEGLIVKSRGRGAFVAEQQTRTWLLQSSEGFFQDEVERRGLNVRSKILRAQRCKLPSWAKEALELPANRRDGVALERLRWVDDKLALYVENWLPESLAATVLDLGDDDSLYERLEQEHSLRVHGGRRVVEAVPAKERLAKILDAPIGTPLMFIESISWDEKMAPFDCYRAWLRTDRIRIEIQVSTTGQINGAADPSS
jgi:GntR family transcriptional regulator